MMKWKNVMKARSFHHWVFRQPCPSHHTILLIACKQNKLLENKMTKELSFKVRNYLTQKIRQSDAENRRFKVRNVVKTLILERIYYQNQNPPSTSRMSADWREWMSRRTLSDFSIHVSTSMMSVTPEYSELFSKAEYLQFCNFSFSIACAHSFSLSMIPFREFDFSSERKFWKIASISSLSLQLDFSWLNIEPLLDDILKLFCGVSYRASNAVRIRNVQSENKSEGS